MIFLSKLEKLTPDIRTYLLANYLSGDESAKALKLQDTIQADSYIQSHAFLRKALSNILNTQPLSLKFYTNTWGKPFLQNWPNIHFNLSHTFGMAALIVNKTYCGIDVEWIKEQNIELIKNVVYHPDELANEKLLKKRPEMLSNFYRIWVIKEAFLKTLGTGLSTDPTSLKVIHIKSNQYKVQGGENGLIDAKIIYSQFQDWAMAYSISADEINGPTKENPIQWVSVPDCSINKITYS